MCGFRIRPIPWIGGVMWRPGWWVGVCCGLVRGPWALHGLEGHSRYPGAGVLASCLTACRPCCEHAPAHPPPLSLTRHTSHAIQLTHTTHTHITQVDHELAQEKLAHEMGSTVGARACARGLCRGAWAWRCMGAHAQVHAQACSRWHMQGAHAGPACVSEMICRCWTALCMVTRAHTHTHTDLTCTPPGHPNAHAQAVVSLVSAQHLWVANCGDSRAVLCRETETVAMSSDHKATRDDEVVGAAHVAFV